VTTTRAYRVRRLLRAPRAAYRRRNLPADADPYGTAVLELHSYGPAIAGFMAATVANRDLLVDVDLPPGAVVVDAGAWLGEWSERIAERAGDATIHAFEPSLAAVDQARQRLAHVPGLQVHPYGLGRRDETALLDDAGPGSSIVHSGEAIGTEVEVRDVVAVFDELGLDHIDLLKVNIEGAEFDVFDRLAEAGWLERIDVISVQFHEWVPEAHRRRRRVRRAFSRTHTETWGYPWIWELWERSPTR
jgi:FkbM family methyltransferase